jgi:hypothetical protein
MHGNVVSSNGEITLTVDTNVQEVILEYPLEFFKIETSEPFYITLNDDTDKILIRYDTSFKIDRFPVYKFKVERFLTDMGTVEFKFSYYGYY